VHDPGDGLGSRPRGSSLTIPNQRLRGVISLPLADRQEKLDHRPKQGRYDYRYERNAFRKASVFTLQPEPSMDPDRHRRAGRIGYQDGREDEAFEAGGE
jgi:hypothetical protein